MSALPVHTASAGLGVLGRDQGGSGGAAPCKGGRTGPGGPCAAGESREGSVRDMALQAGWRAGRGLLVRVLYVLDSRSAVRLSQQDRRFGAEGAV